MFPRPLAEHVTELSSPSSDNSDPLSTSLDISKKLNLLHWKNVISNYFDKIICKFWKDEYNISRGRVYFIGKSVQLCSENLSAHPWCWSRPWCVLWPMIWLCILVTHRADREHHWWSQQHTTTKERSEGPWSNTYIWQTGILGNQFNTKWSPGVDLTVMSEEHCSCIRDNNSWLRTLWIKLFRRRLDCTCNRQNLISIFGIKNNFPPLLDLWTWIQ